jgi:protein TonB
MTANQTPPPGSSGPAEASKTTAAAVVSSGWLGPQSTFGHSDGHTKSRVNAMVTSLVAHGGLAALIIFVLTVVPDKILPPTDSVVFLENVVYPPEPGKGGGGGGSPAPAPPKKVEIPEHKPPVEVPVPVPTPVDPPPVSLIAPIQTNTSALLQSTGSSSVSLAALGGGGSGGGVGPGRGVGVGPGNTAGFGGGAYEPGNGVSFPTVLREVKPIYTPDAMRTKMQGMVTLEIVVKEDGTVGEVRIVKSLDRASGLDAAAVQAAKQWLFKPGMKDGKPVATRVILELEFRLH